MEVDFDTLLESVRAVHSTELLQLQERNAALLGEISQLRREASCKDVAGTHLPCEEVSCAHAPPVMLWEPQHCMMAPAMSLKATGCPVIHEHTDDMQASASYSYRVAAMRQLPILQPSLRSASDGDTPVHGTSSRKSNGLVSSKEPGGSLPTGNIAVRNPERVTAGGEKLMRSIDHIMSKSDSESILRSRSEVSHAFYLSYSRWRASLARVVRSFHFDAFCTMARQSSRAAATCTVVTVCSVLRSSSVGRLLGARKAELRRVRQEAIDLLALLGVVGQAEPDHSAGQWRVADPSHDEFAEIVPLDVVADQVVILNAGTLGYEAQMYSQGADVPDSIMVMDTFAVVWFGIELILRLLTEDLRIKVHAVWNFFDFVILVAAILNLTVDFLPTSYNIVRFLRIARILRVLKVLKIGKTVNNYYVVFAKMTYSLFHSLPSLLSAATVITVFCYMCAVLLTKLSAFHRKDNNYEEDSIGLDLHYGSLDRAFYSLIKAIFGGQSWGELMLPLTHVSFMASFVFMLYLMLTMLCFLNVIHGIFVDAALQSTAHYKELMIAEAQSRRLTLLQHLKEMFREIDADGSGYITVAEFDACLATDGGRAFFEVMGLSTVQAYELFHLIDLDNSASVDIDEFCNGCMKFMGEAKNFDIQCLLAENHIVLQKWTQFTDNFEATINQLLAAALRPNVAGDTVRRLQSGQSQSVGNSVSMQEATSFRNSLEAEEKIGPPPPAERLGEEAGAPVFKQQRSDVVDTRSGAVSLLDELPAVPASKDTADATLAGRRRFL